MEKGRNDRRERRSALDGETVGQRGGEVTRVHERESVRVLNRTLSFDTIRTRNTMPTKSHHN